MNIRAEKLGLLPPEMSLWLMEYKHKLADETHVNMADDIRTQSKLPSPHLFDLGF